MRLTSNQRVIVIARGHLGDILSALPALRDLRATYPGAHITVLANEYVRGVLEHCPFVDDVHYAFAYAPRPAWETLTSRLRLIAGIAGRYDVAVSLRMSPRSGPLLALLSGASIRVGYHQRGLAGRLLTHDLGREPRYLSNRITNLNVVRALGVQGSPNLPRIDWITEIERRNADELLRDRGIAPNERFAVLQIAAHWGCYEWRSDKWSRLCDYLERRHGLKVLVVGTGDPFERSKFAELSRLSHVPVSVQGTTTLPMLFHIVSRATIAIATDSALTQIALAQQAPSVILFGIEPQVRNGPLPEEIGSLMETAQQWEGEGLAPTPNPHCLFGQSHCHTANCRENSSLSQIDVDEVCSRVDRLLQRSPALRPEPRAGLAITS